MVFANHSMTWVQSGFSITATFVVSSMMLLSAGFGLSKGMLGPIALIIAYCASYTIYSHYMCHVKNTYPNFVTLSDIIKTKVGPITGNIMRVQFTVAPVYSMIINLLGIKMALLVFGLDAQAQMLFNIIACTITVAYCWNGGLVSSIRTDILQSAIVIITSVVLFVAMIASDSLDAMTPYLSDPLDWSAVISPGTLFLFIFIGALFSDVELHNRIAAIKDASNVRKSFYLACLLTAIPVLLYGFMAAFATSDAPGSEATLPAIMSQQVLWIQLTFLFMVVALLTSNLDSSLVATATMVTEEWTRKPSLDHFRIAMVVAAAVAIFVASLDLRLVEVFMVYTAIRFATLPVVIAFAKNCQINDRKWWLFFSLAIIVGTIILALHAQFKLDTVYMLMSYLAIAGISTLGLLNWSKHHA